MAEADAPRGFHPVADGDDDVQIVVLDLSADVPAPLLANYPEIPDSSVSIQLTL